MQIWAHIYTYTNVYTYIYMYNAYIYIYIYNTYIYIYMEAGRHLLQAGQAVEGALRHARQLVVGQIKSPVVVTDMS